MEKKSARFRLRVDQRIIGLLQEAGNDFKRACFLHQTQQLKDANYNAEEVIAGYANMQALRKERMELDEERRAFEARHSERCIAVS